MTAEPEILPVEMVDQQAPPAMVLLQLVMGRSISFGIAALARLGVADHMSRDYIVVDELALRSGANADALYRVMRMLASVGVFAQEGRTFALTSVGALLRSDARPCLRNMAAMFSSPWIMRAYENLDRSVQTGLDGVSLAHGKNAWEYFAGHPADAENFHRAMQDFTTLAVDALLESYDFSGIRRLADIGGGYGTLVAGVLDSYPSMQGVILDLPEVIERARTSGVLSGLESRVRFEAGSFFETAPADCDAYILKHIIHDWSDEHACRILTRISERMPDHARVLLFEMIVSEKPEPGPAKILDVEMLAATVGGRERTEQEFRNLFASAGLNLVRVVRTRAHMCVLEAVKS